MRKMRNVMILFLMFAVLFTSTVSAHKGTEVYVDTIKEDLYTENVLERSDVYEKLEIVNNVTGEIEYIESFIGGEYPRYVVTTDKHEFVITSNEEKVSIYKDSVLVQEISMPKIAILPDMKEIGTMGYGDWGPWMHQDESLWPAGLGVAALAVAIGTLLIGPGQIFASYFYGMASAALSSGVGMLYLESSHRVRIDWSHGVYQEDRIVRLYTNPWKDPLFYSTSFVLTRTLDK